MLKVSLLNLIRKSVWLPIGTCHQTAQNDQYFSNCIDKPPHTYSNCYNVLLAGNFNAKEDEPCLGTILDQHNLYNLVKVGKV